MTRPAVAANHTTSVLRVINVDKNAAYPKAIEDLKASGALPESVELRQVKYLNTLIEQDHRFIKQLVKPGMGFFAFETAERTLQGYEVMNMLRKGQMHGMEKETFWGRSHVSPACLEWRPKLSKKGHLAIALLQEFLQHSPLLALLRVQRIEVDRVLRDI